jgi:hypothetical protein
MLCAKKKSPVPSNTRSLPRPQRNKHVPSRRRVRSSNVTQALPVSLERRPGMTHIQEGDGETHDPGPASQHTTLCIKHPGETREGETRGRERERERCILHALEPDEQHLVAKPRAKVAITQLNDAVHTPCEDAGCG